MIERLLGLETGASVSYFEVLLRSPWPRLLILAFILVAAAYSVYLYRKSVPVSTLRRVVMGVLRAAVLGLVVLALFEPILGLEMTTRVRRTILVMLDTSESMATRDARRSEDQIKDAAMALGQVPFDAADKPLPETARAGASDAPRIDLAKGLLGGPTQDVFRRLSRDYIVRYFGFGERLEPAEGKGESAPEALAAAKAVSPATRLGSSIQEAVDRNTGQPIAGVIVITDGISNDGLEPMAVAQRMGQRNVPIYPVGIGLAQAPDVAIRRLIAPEAVFHKDKIPVRVEITSTGYGNRAANLTATLDGREMAVKAVNLTGGRQFEELVFIPDTAAATAKLEMSIAPLPGEVSIANNRVSKTVRVISEQIKVLYVEGKPRWEYRYLRQVLLRDPRLEVKFLLTEGDRDQALSSEQYLTDFPEEAAKAFKFDLVILGDVTSSYFSRAQLERIEELVQKHGGSFLMLAGSQFAPLSYIGSPIASLLPVRLKPEAYQDVEESVTPALADGAAESTVMTLEFPREQNQELWSLVHPLYKLPQLDGPKPGATVLATLSRGAGRGEPYPLIAWQRYGSGKSLFVGTDQLWRLRFKQGDKYHARFWGQAIQFLTLSRLLGESKRIQLETDHQDYLKGQRVMVTANVLDESYQPIKGPGYTVQAERAQPARQTAVVHLEAVPHIPGLYQGYFTPDRPGRYTIRVPNADPAAANTAEFAVTPAELEQLELAMQEDVLRRMADASGGKYFAIRDLPKLVGTVAGDERTTVIRRERELWDLPIVFLAILVLAGTEWLLRRKYDLL